MHQYSKYSVPSHIVNGTRVFIQDGNYQDIAFPIPYVVQDGQIIQSPYLKSEDVSVEPASVLKKKGMLVLPPKYAVSEDGKTKTIVYRLTTALKPDTSVESAVPVHVGLGAVSFVGHGDLRSPHDDLIITGTDGDKSLEMLAQLALHRTFEFKKAWVEADDDDFYNSQEMELYHRCPDGTTNSSPIFFTFTDSRAENSNVREMIFGENGIPRTLINGDNALVLPAVKGNKVQYRFLLTVPNT